MPFARQRGELRVEEDECELEDVPDIELAEADFRNAKATKIHTEEEQRRVKGRAANLARKLHEVEAELAVSEKNLTAAMLPCPVCRMPIDRRNLPLVEEEHLTSTEAIGNDTSVLTLQPHLLQRVRQLQEKHAAILKLRQSRNGEVTLPGGCTGSVDGPSVNNVSISHAEAASTVPSTTSAQPRRWRGNRATAEIASPWDLASTSVYNWQTWSDQSNWDSWRGNSWSDQYGRGQRRW